MWSIGSQRTNELIALIFDTHTLAIGSLENSSKSTQSKPSLTHFSVHPLQAFDVQEGILYNQALMNQIVRSTIKKKNCKVAIALSSSYLQESIVRTSTTNDIQLTLKDHSIVQQHYLYPAEQEGYYHYIYGLHAWLIYQYQLLCINLQFDLVRMESSLSAALRTYHILYASAFRRSQLRQDMQQTAGQLYRVFSADAIARLLDHSYQMKYSGQEESLIACIGLWHACKEENE